MAESVISNTAGMGVLRHKGCKGEPSPENTDGGRRETPAVFAAWACRRRHPTQAIPELDRIEMHEINGLRCCAHAPWIVDRAA